ncbi:MAG: hypothetical protein IIZ54_12380 [Selenomonadaceae bacterium]|nr:hypothetical protein [Selenomonadaceae bacterium]MBQ3971478.1 hypothetical protein [Selenomonadaceae bacterium]
MRYGKSLRNALAAFLVLGGLAMTSPAEAEVLSLEGIGEYYMEDDSMSLSKAKDEAKLLAEIDAVEQARVNVESDTTVQNSKLTKNEITTIAAAILMVQKVDYTISSDFDDVMVVKAVIKADIDTDEIPALVERELKRRQAEQE